MVTPGKFIRHKNRIYPAPNNNSKMLIAINPISAFMETDVDAMDDQLNRRRSSAPFGVWQSAEDNLDESKNTKSAFGRL